MHMFNPKMEKISRKKLEEIQLKRLRKIVMHAYENIPFYRKKIDEAGVNANIKSFDDIEKIPFTTKDDLRKNAPFGLLALPMENYIELHASSGTTGEPVTVCYTQGDIEVWAEVMARCLSMAGLTKKDIFQIPIPYGTFTGAFGFHYGGQKIGALIIPTGKGDSERQIRLMRYYGTTFIAGIASYALHLAKIAKKIDIEPRELNVRNGIFGAEIFTKETKRKIMEEWNMDVHDIYGLTEMCGPGVSADCDEHDGLHIWEDHFFAEIIDPKTGERIEDEEEGELVLTTLTKEGMPIIRYRTRDITFFYDELCNCGRTHRKHAPIKGRSDDMIIVKGTNIFPSQIEEAIMKHEKVGNNWLMILEKIGDMDGIVVKVEGKEKFDEKERRNIEKEIEKEIKIITTLGVKVEIVDPDTLPISEGKAKRVIDRRK
ncbi:MAG TPA: phenylacetate--CoA ligase family protein [Thermoplasmatales archaeon]|nr:phenylacetate--CoA ligase family protein [Thermoplasmatales archaeon]